MAFTNSWDETAPAGTDAISAGDNEIRQFKLDIRERLDSVLNSTTQLGDNSDPLKFAGIAILGDADEVQLTITGFSTQTNLLLRLEDSSNVAQITFAGDGGAIFNEEGNDADFRVEGQNLANLFHVDGAEDAVCIGAVAPTGHGVDFIINSPARTATATEEYYLGAVIPTGAITVPAGTTALVASLYLAEPNLTATGTVTTAATLYILDAPTEASSNYALWVDAGAVRLDGTLNVQGVTTFDDRTEAIISQVSAFTGYDCQNTNTNANAHARVRIVTSGNTGGDPYIYWTISGFSDWSMGIDNSDSNQLKISNATTVGSSDLMTFAAGVITCGQDLSVGANFILGLEMSDPGAPSANEGRIYFRDTGGKTELVVIFASGAVQQIAIEP